jgi:uncharacterized protein YodC (DUF2158 family)
MTFNIGDIVVLKSGGPKMTVYEIEEEDYYCQWFDGKDILNNGTFTISTLEAPQQRAVGVVGMGRR